MISNRFIKFLAAGGLAAVVNFGSRIALSHWMDYIPSIIVAYLFGMTTAFLLNRLFVFSNATNNFHSQAWWFTIVNLAAAAQTLLVSVFLADYVLPAIGLSRNREIIAHGIGIIIPVITSYIGHKLMSFREEKNKAA
jgi:putative flippase GtrA